MLADDAASRHVWLGDDGALAAADKSAIIIDSSTVSPLWIAELAEHAAQRGWQFLDAPVTGSRMQAEAGQLSFLVGGSETALAAATPVLRAMSKEILHLGPVGSGAKLKLINNFLCGVQIASLAQGITWIERSGLDREKSLAFLRPALRAARSSPRSLPECPRRTTRSTLCSSSWPRACSTRRTRLRVATLI